MITQCPRCGTKTIHANDKPNPHNCPLVPRTTHQMLRSNPGTELASLIPEFFKKDGCGCDEYIDKMNKWGVYECFQRKNKIVSHLVSQARAKNLPELLSKPVAERWVQRSLERARNKFPTGAGKDYYVAVTTAPRSPETLSRCVQSLRNCGWEPTVFAEPGSHPIEVRTVNNPTRRGCWGNWLYSARYAVQNSTAPYIMTVQDDTSFHPDSKSLAESYMWPSPDTGFLSLYTPKHYGRQGHNKRPRKPGVARISTISLWGACALIFPREVLEELVEHPRALSWLGVRPKSGNPEVYENRRKNPRIIANADTAIGRTINAMRRTMWFMCPSPATHFATTSTINHGGNAGRRNCNPCADHNQPLADQIPLPRKKQLVNQ